MEYSPSPDDIEEEYGEEEEDDPLFNWLLEQLKFYSGNEGGLDEEDSGHDICEVDNSDDDDDPESDSQVCQLRKSLIEVLEKAHIKIKHTKLTLFDISETESSVLKKLVDDSNDQDSPDEKDDTSFTMAEAPLLASGGNWKKPDDDYFKRIIEKSLFLASVSKDSAAATNIGSKPENKPPAPKLVKKGTARRVQPKKIKRGNSSIPKADAHCVSIINSKSQAGFIDIAPSLSDFYPVNIVTFPLDEIQSDTKPMLSLNDCGRQAIECQMTHKQFVVSSFKSLVSLKDCLKRTTSSVKYDLDNCIPLFCVIGRPTSPVQKNSIIQLNDVFGKNMQKLAQKCFDECINSYEKIDNIRQEIGKHGVIAHIPIRWILLQRDLEVYRNNLQPDDLPIVEFRDCKNMGKMYGMAKDEVIEALVYFHNMSIFLYFGDLLPSIVFLKPQPVVDKLAELMSSCRGVKNGVCQRKLLRDLEFEAECFKQEEFELLMRRILVIAMLPEDDEFFFPGILSYATPEKLPKYGNIEPLVIALPQKEDIFPVSLFLALVFKLLSRETPPKFKINNADETIQYRNAICLTCDDLGGSIALIDSGSYLEIYYSGSTKHCFKIRNVIHEEIPKAVDENGWRNSLKELKDCFFCSIEGHGTRDHLCFVNCKSLDSITCCKNGIDTSSEVTALGRKTEWLTDDVTYRGRSGKPDIKKVHDILCKEPGAIQHKWQDLALALGMRPEQINVRTEDSQVYKLYIVLQQWQDISSKEQFTWGILVEAIRVQYVSPAKAKEIEKLFL